MTENALSPFSQVVLYEGVNTSGFLGKPRADQFHAGWGEPFKDSEGNPIKPGTVGGPYPHATLQKRNGKWGLLQNKRLQSVGPISWYGKHRTTKPDAKRWVLSFHGPISRHFPSDFEYGTSATHNEVYFEGGLAGIAPGPVLGAALQSIALPDKPVVRWLMVVCLYQGGESVFKRPFKGALYLSQTDPETIAALQNFKDEQHPDGWETIGGVTGITEYDRAKTPWFFNESGTEAQCLKLKDKFGLDPEGAPVTEKAGDRFKLTVGQFSVSTAALGNDEPFKYTASGTSTNTGLWTSPVDPFGFPHTWEENNVQVEWKMEGKQVVAVDYVGDTEVVVRMVIDTLLRFDKDHMKGVDDVHGISPPSQQGPWDNRNQYNNPNDIGVDRENFSVGDHSAGTWYAGQVLTTLEWTINQVEYVLPIENQIIQTSDMFDGRPYTPPNRVMFFRQNQIYYLRYLDVRGDGFLAARLYVYKNFVTETRKSEIEVEITDTDFQDDKVQPYLQATDVWGSAPLVSTSTLLRNNSTAFNAVRALPPTWTYSVTSFIGSRPTYNDTAVKGEIPYPDWYPASLSQLYNGWYGMKLLKHQHLTDNCGFAHREDGSWVVSGVFLDFDSKALKEISASSPFDIESLASAAIFHPLGEM